MKSPYTSTPTLFWEELPPIDIEVTATSVPSFKGLVGETSSNTMNYHMKHLLAKRAAETMLEDAHAIDLEATHPEWEQLPSFDTDDELPF